MTWLVETCALSPGFWPANVETGAPTHVQLAGFVQFVGVVTPADQVQTAASAGGAPMKRIAARNAPTTTKVSPRDHLKMESFGAVPGIPGGMSIPFLDAPPADFAQ